MNVPFLIARKYFFSKKKRSFINFISVISMLGLALGTMSLVIVLSVFNGLENLNRQVFKAIDPDLKISSDISKSFIAPAGLLDKIKSMNEVASVLEVYQDKALARSKDAQMIVQIKGVDESFEKNASLNNSIVEGKLKLFNNNRPQAFVGVGVSEILSLGVEDFLNPLILIYPNAQKLDVLNPEANINKEVVELCGTFELEQQYDNYVYLPLTLVEKLTDKVGKRTAIEISLKKNVDADEVKSKIAKLIVGQNLNIKNRDEQNAALLKAIKIEKLFIFIALIFIIGIASFNIFYALSMLVIDKKDDIQTLSSIGVEPSFISKIFMYEGFIIATIGLALGLAMGISLCLLQIKFGIIKLGIQNAIVSAYPVKIILSDILLALVGVLIITFFASVIPAQKSKKFMLNLD